MRIRITVLLLGLAALAGCSAVPSPQRGGFASMGKALVAPFSVFTKPAAPAAILPGATAQPAKGVQAQLPPEGEGMSIAQPDNPGQQSAQNLKVTREDEIVFAAPATLVTEAEGTRQTLAIPAGSRRLSREVREAGQTIGAAQKDTARADAAWLASFQKVQFFGIAALLGGIVCFAHPAARALVGKDTAAMVAGAGLVMIFGPAFLKEYGNWFAAALLAAGVYWFFSRAKYKEGRLDELERSTRPPFPR